jgi:Rrf2 family protein
MSKIVNLSEAASIALHSVIVIGRSKKPVNADKIADITGSSRHHVAKIMQRLSKAGYVGSTRGPAGGFHLICDVKKTTLLDVYEIIEGKIIASSCPVDKQVCNFDKCFVNNITSRMTTDFINYLKSQTLKAYL